MGEAPTHTVTHIKTKTKADICRSCLNDSMKHAPFTKGIDAGEIKVTAR
jgi:hypothetical protein